MSSVAAGPRRPALREGGLAFANPCARCGLLKLHRRAGFFELLLDLLGLFLAAAAGQDDVEFGLLFGSGGIDFNVA
jgi:hypothetical protein